MVDDIFHSTKRHLRRGRRRNSPNLTLSRLIKILEFLPDHMIIHCANEMFSYRGYYDDLAIGFGETTVGELLKTARSALGHSFTGYKGGEYLMGEDTLLWQATDSGHCSDLAVIGVKLIDSNNGKWVAMLTTVEEKFGRL